MIYKECVRAVGLQEFKVVSEVVRGGVIIGTTPLILHPPPKKNCSIYQGAVLVLLGLRVHGVRV